MINRWIQVQSLVITNIWKAIKCLKGEAALQGSRWLMEGCRKASRQRCACEPGSPRCLQQRLRRACSSWRKWHNGSERDELHVKSLIRRRGFGTQLLLA